jgi:hypothetical protein
MFVLALLSSTDFIACKYSGYDDASSHSSHFHAESSHQTTSTNQKQKEEATNTGRVSIA